MYLRGDLELRLRVFKVFSGHFLRYWLSRVENLDEVITQKEVY